MVAVQTHDNRLPPEGLDFSVGDMHNPNQIHPNGRAGLFVTPEGNSLVPFRKVALSLIRFFLLTFLSGGIQLT